MVARIELSRTNDRLSATRDQLRRSLYASRTTSALAAWEANDVGQLSSLFDQARMNLTDGDLRGWEWGYLQRLARPARVTFREHDREVSRVVFSPDGRLIASAQWGGAGRVLGSPSTGSNC